MGVASYNVNHDDSHSVVRRFKARDSSLLVRKFPAVSAEAVNIIASSAPVYGSQARALQVATEILIWQKEPIRLRYRIKRNGAMTTASYKLLPRTVELINKLTPIYGRKAGSMGERRAGVIEACASIIEQARDKK